MLTNQLMLIVQGWIVLSLQTQLGLAHCWVRTLDIERTVVAWGLVRRPRPLEQILGLYLLLDEGALGWTIFTGPRLLLLIIHRRHLLLIINNYFISLNWNGLKKGLRIRCSPRSLKSLKLIPLFDQLMISEHREVHLLLRAQRGHHVAHVPLGAMRRRNVLLTTHG